MLSIPIEYSRLLDASDVVHSLQIPKAREAKKWSCPKCSSSDALHVYPGPGRGAYCFSCGDSFDAIDLAQTSMKMDFRGAIVWLANEFGFGDLIDEGHEADLASHRRRQKEIQQQIREREEERRRIEAERLKSARSVYAELFRNMSLGPAGERYLEDRAIPREVAVHFGLQSVESMEEWEKVRSSVWPEDLEEAGLTGHNERGAYPVPWRAPFLVIPYADDKGITMLRFRDLNGGTPKYLSPLGFRPPHPYQHQNAYSFADEFPTLFVCEGELDALSVILAGAPAVGSCGQGVWASEWSENFRWYSQVVILCDGDEAGDQFSRRVRDATERSLGKDWVERRLRRRRFVDGVDANDALVSGDLKELLDVA